MPLALSEGRCVVTYATLEEAFAATAKRTGGDFVAAWHYSHGGIVARFALPDGRKTFRPYRPTDGNGDGGGYEDGDPPGLWPLYRRDDLERFPDDPVFLAEGEAKADALAAVGLVAVAAAHGANGAAKTDWRSLAGRAVYILPDNDGPGRMYAGTVAGIVTALDPPASVRIVDLPGLPVKGDFVDWIGIDGPMADRTPAEIEVALLHLAAEAPAWTPDAGRLDVRAFNRTDSGNAEMLAALYGDRLRFDHRRGRFLVFAGHSWRQDADGAIDRLVLEAARARFHAAADVADTAEKSAQAKWAMQSESRQRREAALALGRSVPPIADAGDGWDTDPHLVGVVNGVIDLRTGGLRAGRPGDRITLALPWAYRPDAKAPRWERFVSEIFGGDVAMVDFSGRAVGYSLTGLTVEQVLFVLYGTGANGKSVFLSTLRHVFGPLAVNAPFATFELNGRGAATNDVAALADRRLVTASEVAEGARLNEVRVKALTGGDALTARFLYGEFFSFVPVAKIWLAVNHKPRVADDSVGFWRRVRLIPFVQRFEGDKADPHLAEALRAEAEGILAWTVRGALAWQARGLEPPECVTTATAAYRDESDPLSDFLASRCETGPRFIARAGDVKREYDTWADGEGLSVRERLSATALGRRLAERFTKDRDREGRFYRGLRMQKPGL